MPFTKKQLKQKFEEINKLIIERKKVGKDLFELDNETQKWLKKINTLENKERSIHKKLGTKVDFLSTHLLKTKQISMRCYQIVRMRFGIGYNSQCKTLEEVGREFGVTRERIRNIEEEFFNKIK